MKFPVRLRTGFLVNVEAIGKTKEAQRFAEGVAKTLQEIEDRTGVVSRGAGRVVDAYLERRVLGKVRRVDREKVAVSHVCHDSTCGKPKLHTCHEKVCSR